MVDNSSEEVEGKTGARLPRSQSTSEPKRKTQKEARGPFFERGTNLMHVGVIPYKGGGFGLDQLLKAEMGRSGSLEGCSGQLSRYAVSFEKYLGGKSTPTYSRRFARS